MNWRASGARFLPFYNWLGRKVRDRHPGFGTLISGLMATVKLPEPLEPLDPTHVLSRRRRLVYFGGCDYFRLGWHPEVREEVKRAVSKWGIHPAASRRTTGNHELYEELEYELCQFFRTPSAVLVSNGYVCNQIVAQTVAGRFSHVLIDRLAHASLRDASHCFDAPVLEFSHRDPTDLRQCVRRLGTSTRPMVLTDGLFAHDGSVAPLAAYRAVAPSGTWFLVDDAHGAGVLGHAGRGTLEHLGAPRSNTIQTISLSKAFGCYGGAILGSRQLCESIRARSRFFAGNTPLPLPMAAGALTAVNLLKKHARWRADLQATTRRIKDALAPFFPPASEAPGPMIGHIARSNAEVVRWRNSLIRAGIFPTHLRYAEDFPHGVFRFAISSKHLPTQLDALTATLICLSHRAVRKAG